MNFNVIIIILTLLGLQCKGQLAEKQYIVPAKFEGICMIVFNGNVLQTDNLTVFNLPDSGILFVNTNFINGPVINRFYFMERDTLHEIEKVYNGTQLQETNSKIVVYMHSTATKKGYTGLDIHYEYFIIAPPNKVAEYADKVYEFTQRNLYNLGLAELPASLK